MWNELNLVKSSNLLSWLSIEDWRKQCENDMWALTEIAEHSHLRFEKIRRRKWKPNRKKRKCSIIKQFPKLEKEIELFLFYYIMILVLLDIEIYIQDCELRVFLQFCSWIEPKWDSNRQKHYHRLLTEILFFFFTFKKTKEWKIAIKILNITESFFFFFC